VIEKSLMELAPPGSAANALAMSRSNMLDSIC